MVTGGNNNSTGNLDGVRSIEVHDKDGKFRCELSNYLLLPSNQHTQTAYEYTSGNTANHLKFQVCGGVNYNASRTCQTFDDINTKVLSPSLNTSRQAHVSYTSRANPCSSADPCLILMGGFGQPRNTTEIYDPPADRFTPYLDVDYPIQA